MTRNGKIARLPYCTRDILNRRLHNGEQGTKLVKWLNGLSQVQEVLAEEFGGRPISEQNLSEWKQGGFEDWLRHQETREWVQKLADESADLEEDAGDFSVADRLAPPLAVALGRWIHEVAAGAQNHPEQRKALLAIAREVAELRRSDHTAERVRIERERWDAERQEKQNEELEKLKRQAEGAANFQAIFARFAESERRLEALKPRVAPFTGHQTGSNPIQPNQTDADKT
jgi:hypothetical protein